MNKVKRQHWIPKMIIKEWIDENDSLKYFSKQENNHKESTYNRNKKKFANDPFIENEMYEREGVEENFTEKKLAWIENEFSIVKDKITKSQRNNELKLNRKDLEIIKTFITTMNSRNKSILKRFDEADGNPEFKKLIHNKTIEEKKEILFSRVDKTILLQQLKLDNTDHKHDLEILKLKKELYSVEFGGFLNDMSFTSLKFFRTSRQNFILTDQYGTNIINPFVPGSFLIGFFPITPNLCVGLLYENEKMRISRRLGMDPLEVAKKYVSNELKINYDKFFEFDAKRHYVKFGEYTYDDSFKYKFNQLDANDVSVMNAFLETQASDIVVYKDESDLKETYSAKEKYGIFRGEDIFKNNH